MNCKSVLGRTAAPIIVAAGLALAAFAQPVEVNDRNAALAYWAAWSCLNPKATTLISEIDWKQVGTTTDAAAMPSAFQEYTRLDAGDSGVTELIEASKLSKCDFEIRYSQGFQALLPHLGKARNGVRILRAEARERLVNGNVDGSADCIAAMVRCGNHMGNDQILISSLVGFSCINAAIDEYEAIKASGRMTEAARRTLLKAFRAVNANDPVRVGDAVRFESSVWGTIDRLDFTGADAGADAAKYFHDLAGMNSDVRRDGSDPLKTLETLDEAGYRADLANLRKAGDAVRDAWSGDNAVAKLDRLEASVKAGAYGVMAQVILPALAKARQQTDDFSAKVAKIVAELERR